MVATDMSMEGKVCLVTGGTGGLGLATARALAVKGATLVIAGKNASKGASAEETIKEETGNAHNPQNAQNAQVEFMQVDLSSQQDIRRFAEAFQRKYPRLDVLVNNAGGYFWRREESVDGLEMTFALNHMGPFLLTNLLLDTLKASAPSRIVNVSSGVHTSEKINFNDLQLTRKYNGRVAYGRSKLANLLFTYELARRLEGTGVGASVTVNALSPGLVATDIGTQGGGIALLGKRVIDRLMGQTPEQGAQTSIYLASSPEVEGVTGKYFTKCQPTDSSEYSRNQNVARRLWHVSEQLAGR